MPPLGPRTQTRETRGALVRAFNKRQQNLRQVNKGHSDVKRALQVGERVHKRYDTSTANPLVKGKLGSRPFPYGSERQVQDVNYQSLADDVLRHLAHRYGGKTSKARVVPTRGAEGFAYQGLRGVYVSPDTPFMAFSGNPGARDDALTTPVHEYAHTRQRPSIRDTGLVEGGADLFMRAIAPRLYDTLGIPGVTSVPSSPRYERYARRVQKRGGLRYVLERQFR
jgi:hypothetical protein